MPAVIVHGLTGGSSVRTSLSLVGLVLACCPPDDPEPWGPKPTITTRYSPLHPGNDEPLSITATATSCKHGIANVEIQVFERAHVGEEDGRRVKNLRTDSRKFSKRFEGLPAYTATTFRADLPGYPPSTELKVVARVQDAHGRVAEQSFALTAGDWPYDRPVPLWASGDQTVDPRHTWDVVFVAHGEPLAASSVEAPPGRAILGALEHVLFDGYFANALVRESSAHWQFYYLPHGVANAGKPHLDVPAEADIGGLADAIGVMHEGEFASRSEGRPFAANVQIHGVALHETAHSILGLQDEYASGNVQANSINVLSDQSSCERHNRDNGWPAEDCTNFMGSFYKPEPDRLNCLMFAKPVNYEFVPEFGRTCAAHFMVMLSRLLREGVP